jgi:hypothetical protein
LQIKISYFFGDESAGNVFHHSLEREGLSPEELLEMFGQ